MAELPHTGRARMIVRVEGEGECIARIAPDHPAVRDGRVPAAVLLELGAQAAAALVPEGSRPGRVVAVQRLRWHAPTVPAGEELRVRATLVETAGALANHAFEVEGYGEGVVGVWLT